MNGLAVNQALLKLLAIQSVAKFRRLGRRMTSRRRIVTTLVALGLSLVWLGNAVFSITVRDPYPAATFRMWVSLGLMLYCGWHIIRVAWKRPETAIEWTPAEAELLCGGPFTRRELLSYRLTVILSATLVKAGLASLFLLPDLKIWWCGFVGFLLGLTFIEYFRVVLETVACGVSSRIYNAGRVVVFGGVIAVGVFLISDLTQQLGGEGLQSIREWGSILAGWGESFNAFRATSLGRAIKLPFAVFADLVTARTLQNGTWMILGGAIAILTFTAQAAVIVDGAFFRRAIRKEQSAYVPGAESLTAERMRQGKRWSLPRMIRSGGAGPVAWRQLLGVKHHFGSLVAALLVPGILSCLALAVKSDPITSFLSVLASVIFYSFVLLPAALKFDFRRDYDRLPLLKMLPLSPGVIAVGQLFTPVFITTMFQTLVLTAAAAVRPVAGDLVWGAVLMLIPMNVFFVALDNLIFMLSPHRINQEGFEVFLRSTLTFTAKALLLGVLMVIVAGWAVAAPSMAVRFGVGSAGLFFFGLGLIWAILGTMTFALLVKTFSRYDPSLDAAG